MKLHVIYRSAPGDSKSDKRPIYFNKTNCLISFLSSYKKLQEGNRGDLIFLNDGEVSKEQNKLMNSVKSEIINLGGVGNSSSLKSAYGFLESKSWDDDDMVYFAEDDYLYKEEAFPYLINAIYDIDKADYFSLYDHPDRYTRVDDVDSGKGRVFISRNSHWRTIESTCQTYGVFVGILKKDLWIHKIGTLGNTPQGREMFRASQGIGKYFLKFPKRVLVSPIPSLCSHMESEFLAKNVDWEQVNKLSEVLREIS